MESSASGGPGSGLRGHLVPELRRNKLCTARRERCTASDIFHEKARRRPSRSPPSPSEQSELVLHCVVKLFVGVHHVLMGLLNVIELLLLIRCEQRPNLRYRAVHYSFHFLHRLLMNGGDLRVGAIDNRLNLGLLVGRQVQLLGYSLEAKAMSMPAATAASTGLCLHYHKAAKRNRTGGHKC